MMVIRCLVLLGGDGVYGRGGGSSGCEGDDGIGNIR